MALLLLVMPWTEHFWHFDKFVLGGQDFEFSLLTFVIVLSLILLLSQRRKQALAVALAFWQWLSSGLLPNPANPGGINHVEWISASHANLTSHPSLKLYTPPLRV
jgi:hypothetical protein